MVPPALKAKGRERKVDVGGDVRGFGEGVPYTGGTYRPLNSKIGPSFTNHLLPVPHKWTGPGASPTENGLKR